MNTNQPSEIAEAAENTNHSSEIAESTTTNYQVTINMSDDTANALVDSGYFLYGFKAVQSSNQAGKPLVWFQSADISPQTTIEWTESYQAFTSKQDIIAGGIITAKRAYNIAFGQRLTVTNGSGTGEVSTDGEPGTILIENMTTTQFTCGISQMQGNVPAPLCAFPLYGSGNTVAITPIEKILLIFATQLRNVGTIIERAFSAGFMIELTGVINERTVQYDINQGWAPTNKGWATVIPAHSNLVEKLIDVSPSMLKQPMEVR